MISSKIEIFVVKSSGGGFSGRILLLGTRPDEILSFWFLMVRPQEKPPREKKILNEVCKTINMDYEKVIAQNDFF